MKLVEGGVPIKFLSTPSARRATAQHGVTQCPLQISTHALREEGDGIDLGIKDKDLQFLSTPSARRATITLSEFFAKAEDFYPRPP